MYKRRRTAMPILPRNPQSSDQAVSVSRFASLGQSSFYRGQVTDGNNDTALMFATDGQLELLRSSRLIFIDSTFRVVPRLYYQLLTIFVSHVDYTFHVFYSLMTCKRTELYKAVVGKLKELASEFGPNQVIADCCHTSCVRQRRDGVGMLVSLRPSCNETIEEDRFVGRVQE